MDPLLLNKFQVVFYCGLKCRTHGQTSSPGRGGMRWEVGLFVTFGFRLVLVCGLPLRYELPFGAPTWLWFTLHKEMGNLFRSY